MTEFGEEFIHTARELSKSNAASEFTKIVILTIELMIGVSLQLRKIKRVKQEKAFTWELEIYHSIICISFFGFEIFVEILEQLIPEVDESTQRILCTVIWFIKTWGVTSIFLHSLSISICKYVVIVYFKGMNAWLRRTEKLVISSIVAFPVLWTMLALISDGGTPSLHQDYITPQISMCNGLDLREKQQEPCIRSFFCGFCETPDSQNRWIFIFMTTEFFCIIQSIITLFVNMNILEVFLYLMIFRAMNR